jgi:hypothetical protein
MKKWDKQTFIERAKAVHGDKYDYSKVVYVNATTNIEIVCPTHGSFLQQPNSHINQKQGCKKCAGKYQDRDGFVADAIAIHDDRYDYSKVKYINSMTKVEILCREHGTFSMSPNSHVSVGRNRTLAEIVRMAHNVHHNRYDYSLVEQYTVLHNKVSIVCPEHGPFEQTLRDHIHNKQGCPLCAYRHHRGRYQYVGSNTLQHVPAQFYVVRLESTEHNFIKVGVTKNTWNTRLAKNSYKGFSVTLLLTYNDTMDKCLDIETECLETMQTFRYNKPLDFHGHTECFVNTPLTVAIIEQILKDVTNG